jgi:two-component system, LytTR family, response regulator
MPEVRALVVEDEPAARRRILRLLREDRDVRVVGVCAGGPEAAASILEGRPEILFLGIRASGPDAFGILEELGAQRPPVVVVVSASERFAVRAFEVRAADYLRRPFSRARFREVLTRAKERLEESSQREIAAQLQSVLKARESETDHLERLMIRVDGRIHPLRVADIEWIEADGHYVKLHLGKATRQVRETMSDLETRLDPKVFVRVHRSVIVNLARVREIERPARGGVVIVLRSGQRLAMGSSFGARLERVLEGIL